MSDKIIHGTSWKQFISAMTDKECITQEKRQSKGDNDVAYNGNDEIRSKTKQLERKENDNQYGKLGSKDKVQKGIQLIWHTGCIIWDRTTCGLGTNFKKKSPLGQFVPLFKVCVWVRIYWALFRCWRCWDTTLNPTLSVFSRSQEYSLLRRKYTG